MPLGPEEEPDRFEDFDACVDALSEEMPEEQARRVCGSWENQSTNDMKQSTDRPDEQFDKRVEFKATDEERRVAIGGVMVPDKVDLQGDWVEADTIEQFSDAFMAELQASDGDAVPGVMHAAFPEDHVSLAENRVLDEDTEIGGKEFPAGSWLQGWKFADDELWALVQDDVLSGYSIGASNVEWGEPTSQDDLPDGVKVAADYPEDEPAWQILDGKVGEVSSVDLPAVPDAVMVAAKAGDKSVLDSVGGKNEFIGVMEDRGHSEDDAERLWHYLQRAMDETDGKAAPDPSDGFLRRLGKSAWSALTGGDTNQKTAATDGGTEKESRTLSQANKNRLMAAHDALEDAISSDVQFEGNRFTDNPTVDFDVSDYGKAYDESAESDTDSDTKTDTMSDDNAIDVEEKFEALEKRLDDIEAKASDGDGDGDEDADKDADAVAGLEEQLESLEDKIDSLAEASGKSQQLSGGSEEESNSPTKADILGLPGGEA